MAAAIRFGRQHTSFLENGHLRRGLVAISGTEGARLSLLRCRTGPIGCRRSVAIERSVDFRAEPGDRPRAVEDVAGDRARLVG
jgi:hypothetical protein